MTHSCSKAGKAQQALAVFTALMLNVAVLTCIYWAFFDQAPPAVLVEEPTIEDASLLPGETARVTYEVLQVRNCPGWIHQVMIGARFYTLEGRRYYQEPHTTRSITNSFTVPADAQPGSYQYRTFIDYACNPLRTITFATPAVKLQVVQ